MSPGLEAGRGPFHALSLTAMGCATLPSGRALCPTPGSRGGAGAVDADGQVVLDVRAAAGARLEDHLRRHGGPRRRVAGRPGRVEDDLLLAQHGDQEGGSRLTVRPRVGRCAARSSRSRRWPRPAATTPAGPSSQPRHEGPAVVAGAEPDHRHPASSRAGSMPQPVSGGGPPSGRPTGRAGRVTRTRAGAGPQRLIGSFLAAWRIARRSGPPRAASFTRCTTPLIFSSSAGTGPQGRPAPWGRLRQGCDGRNGAGLPRGAAEPGGDAGSGNPAQWSSTSHLPLAELGPGLVEGLAGRGGQVRLNVQPGGDGGQVVEVRDAVGLGAEEGLMARCGGPGHQPVDPRPGPAKWTALRAVRISGCSRPRATASPRSWMMCLCS